MTVNQLLANVYLFLFFVTACLVANIISWLIKERVDTNTPFLRRLLDVRYNHLAILYKEVRNTRLDGHTDDQVQKIILDRYNNRSLPFMLSASSSPRYIESIAFVGNVIKNKVILFEFASKPDFNKKAFKELLKHMEQEEKDKEVREALRRILKDKSPESVNMARNWFPQLFIDFIPDPDDEERTISPTENQFSVLFYLKGIFLDETTSLDPFVRSVKALQKYYSQMRIVGSKSHSTNYIKKMNLADKRCTLMREFVEKRTRSSK